MQDYNINVNYNKTITRKTQSISSQATTYKKTQVKSQEEKVSQSGFNYKKATAVGLGAATKINQYIGELTENTVTQRKRQLGITAVGLAVLGISNPVGALAAGAALVGNSAIQYNIKAYKENLSADFLKSLSGGVYNTRK